MKNIYLEGGKICTSHGVKGLVKVDSVFTISEKHFLNVI